MPDLTIERCLVRIVRRGGWAWGPDPRGLVRGVIARLPALLAQQLGSLLDSLDLETNIVVEQPVIVNVTLRRGELASLTRDGEQADAAILRFLESALAEQLPALLTKAALSSVAGASTSVHSAGSVAGQSFLPGTPTVEMLLGWRTEGRLSEWLLALDAEAIRLLESTVLELIPHASRIALSEHALQLVTEALATQSAPMHEVARRRWRLAISTELLAQIRATESSGLVTTQLGAILSAVQTAESLRAGHSPASSAQPDLSARTTVREEPTRPSVRHSLAAHMELRIRTALPFLLLRPLSRLGYWDTLAAFLEQTRETETAPVFAAAFAYKVLNPLHAQWRRAPGDGDAAAAFAGLLPPVPDPELHQFASRVERQTALLDLFPAMALQPSHAAEQPLWLTREKSGYVLWEPDGLYPIRCAANLPEVFAVIGQWGGPLLLADLPAKDLLVLDHNGFTFITATSPGRVAAWKGLPGGRHWTNGSSRPPVPLSFFTDAPQKQVWQALAEERRAFPLLPDCRLERTLTVAVALGLGSLAWDLWRSHEPVSPLLPLERFKDLEALVTIAPEQIRVRLPLGARFIDLEKHGCLATVSRLPWLGNRSVEFARW